MLGLESIPNRMMRLGTSELYFGELNSIDFIVQQIEVVSQDDIQAVAHELFREDNLSTVIIQPESQSSDLTTLQ